MYFMVVNYISYVEKTYYQAIITVSVGLVNVPLNYFLILEFGAVGSGMAFACSFFLLFVFTWILSGKLYSMPWFTNILCGSKAKIQ
jgi:O-antigen/teichoic acid export membrane protein